MAKYKLVNGVQVELTAEEVTQREAEEAAAKVEEEAVKFKISREIHFLNDERSKVKLEINSYTGSKIREIKKYTNYS